MDDVDTVQLLHHVQDTDGEVHDQRLRHHLIAQGFIDVHCVLKVQPQCQNQLHVWFILPRHTYERATRTHQQGAVVVKLPEQHTSIVEEVSRVNAAVKMTDVRLQPSIQLCVDVKLPGIGRLLNLCSC